MLTHIPTGASTWTTVDRTGWAPGPWDDEPDKVSWTDPDTERPCLVTRHWHDGHLCGYVAVDPGHVLHGVDSELASRLLAIEREINYSAYCEPDAPEERGICHVPKAGAPHDVWWFGFHCSHSWDMSPSITRIPDWQRLGFGPYRQIDYVIGRVQVLATQLHAVGLLPAEPVRELLEMELPE